MDRRRFIATLGGALALPSFAIAQKPDRLPVVGLLSPQPTPTPEQWANTPFAKRLRELGWIEGKNVVVVQARGEGRPDRMPALAAELVRKRADVILALAPEAAVAAARATKAIPIVFWGVGSPVELGLVTSFARPAGNITGVAWNAAGEVQVAKTLEFLKQIAPSARRLASIWDPTVSHTVSGTEYAYPGFEVAAKSLGYELRSHEVKRDEDLDSAFAAILEWRAEALVIPAMPFTGRNRQRIVEFANRNRLPSAFDLRFFVEAGGLVSYGPDMPETQRRAVDYVDRILRGARPGDLPVELPSRFELAVNLRTARALGLTVPQAVLLRADRVIE
jgi:putative ABC transport system substrate-binding protein